MAYDRFRGCLLDHRDPPEKLSALTNEQRGVLTSLRNKLNEDERLIDTRSPSENREILLGHLETCRKLCWKCTRAPSNKEFQSLMRDVEGYILKWCDGRNI